MKEKFVRNVIKDGENFMLVTSKDYDRDIDILCTADKEFNASIIRSIEPKGIKVFDSLLKRDG